jgi:hypothetical protein
MSVIEDAALNDVAQIELHHDVPIPDLLDVPDACQVRVDPVCDEREPTGDPQRPRRQPEQRDHRA